MNVNKTVKWMTISVIILVTLIGAGGFILSYGALLAIGIQNGMPGDWRGFIWPLLTDMGLVVFTLALLTAQVTRQKVGWWVIGVGGMSLASMAFNVSHANLIDDPTYRTALTVVVNVWPPLMLVLTTEALRHLLKTVIDRAGMVVTMTELGNQKSDLERQRETLERQKTALQNEVAKLRQAQTELASRPDDAHTIADERERQTRERREKILEAVKAGTKSVSKLATLVDASETTIRRDLQSLNGKAKEVVK